MTSGMLARLLEESPVARRRLVLWLYALVGPVFTLVLYLEAVDPWRLPAVGTVAAIIVLPALMLFLRRAPGNRDWAILAGVAPTLCCGIGFLATGTTAPAYLGVLGAPLAWSAVLFGASIVWTALAVSSATCFAVVTVRLGLGHAVANTVIFATIFGLVAAVVYLQAKALRVARRSLQVALSRDRAVLNALPDVVATADAEGRFTRVHGAEGSELPLPAEQLIGRAVYDFLPSEAHKTVRDAISRVLHGAPVASFEYAVAYPNGPRIFDFRLVRSMPDEIVAVRRDITELRTGQERLRQSEQRYRRLFENLREEVTVFDVVRDEHGRVTNWLLREANAFARESFGGRYARSLGEPVTALAEAAIIRPHFERSEEILSGHACVLEQHLPGADRHCRIGTFAIDQDTIVMAALDITERRRAEEQVRGAFAVAEKSLADLREAQRNLKTLSGLLPICMYCKKIRDDKGYWEQVDTFITKHADVLFSHGMCPDCGAKYLADNFPEDG